MTAWNNDTEVLLNGAVFVTCSVGGTVGLLTVRGKVHDLTAEDCDALAEAFGQAADRLRGKLPASEALYRVGGILNCLLATFADGDLPKPVQDEIAECVRLCGIDP